MKEGCAVRCLEYSIVPARPEFRRPLSKTQSDKLPIGKGCCVFVSQLFWSAVCLRRKNESDPLLGDSNQRIKKSVKREDGRLRKILLDTNDFILKRKKKHVYLEEFNAKCTRYITEQYRNATPTADRMLVLDRSEVIRTKTVTITDGYMFLSRKRVQFNGGGHVDELLFAYCIVPLTRSFFSNCQTKQSLQRYTFVFCQYVVYRKNMEYTI